jgi:HD-GYP domain-containing protein (c-di-GMP phosphodiesterase class II)
MIRIAIMEGGGEVRTHLLQQATIRIGRDQTNEVVLRDNYVSGRHGDLRVSANGVLYEDFVTTNGSLVRRDGKLIEVDGSCLYQVRLQDGDELLLGDSDRPMHLKVNLIAIAPAPPSLDGDDATLFGGDLGLDVTRVGAVEDLRARFDREALLALQELCSGMNAHLELDGILDVFGDSLLRLFRKANHVAVFTKIEQTGEYEAVMSCSRAGGADEAVQPMSRTVRDRVLACGEAVTFSDTDAGFDLSESLHDSNVRAGICAPLWNGQKIGGMVQVDRRGAVRGAFDRRDLEVLAVFAHQAALSIENARLHEGLQHTMEKSIRGLVRALEAKDEYTSGHSEVVADLCREVALVSGMDAGEAEDIARAAVLHDIGKIGIPYHVLNKEGRLTPDEFVLLKSHPDLGARILEPFDFMAHLIPIVLHHHERWDGRGYPSGLAGEDIPFGARILGVVDTYHALVSDRAYRKGVGIPTALAELRRCSGSQFDPEAVELLCRVLEARSVRSGTAPIAARPETAEPLTV